MFRVNRKDIGIRTCVISGFRREVDENCARMGYYAASGGNILPKFRDNPSVQSSGASNPKGSIWIRILHPPEDGTDRLFRNVFKKLRTQVL